MIISPFLSPILFPPCCLFVKLLFFLPSGFGEPDFETGLVELAFFDCCTLIPFWAVEPSSCCGSSVVSSSLASFEMLATGNCVMFTVNSPFNVRLTMTLKQVDPFFEQLSRQHCWYRLHIFSYSRSDILDSGVGHSCHKMKQRSRQLKKIMS